MGSAAERIETSPAPQDDLRDNPIVRFVETMQPAERAAVDRMAELQRLHGDEPTPQR